MWRMSRQRAPTVIVKSFNCQLYKEPRTTPRHYQNILNPRLKCGCVVSVRGLSMSVEIENLTFLLDYLF